MTRFFALAVVALTTGVGCANEDVSTASGDQAATAGAAVPSSSFTTPKGTQGTFAFTGTKHGAARTTILTLSRAGKVVELECGVSGESAEPELGAGCRLNGGAPWWPFPIPAEEQCDVEMRTAVAGPTAGTPELSVSCGTTRSVRATPTSAPKVSRVPLTQPQTKLLELINDASGWKSDSLSTRTVIARGALTVLGTPNTDPARFGSALGDVAKGALGKTLPFAAGVGTPAAKAGLCTTTDVVLYPDAYAVGDTSSAVHTVEGEALVRAQGTRTDDGTFCDVVGVMSWRGQGGWVADAATLGTRLTQASYRSSF